MKQCTFVDHVGQIRICFSRIYKSGLNINAKKCSFKLKKIPYLSYIITREGLKLVPNKIQGIMDIKRHKTTTDCRNIIVMFQYFCGIWKRSPHVLAPITESSVGKKGTPIERMQYLEQYFVDHKRIISEERGTIELSAPLQSISCGIACLIHYKKCIHKEVFLDMIVPEHTVVGTIVPAEIEVLRPNTCVGGNIQSSLGITKVYYTDLGKLCRIHTLELFCTIIINYDIIKINLSGYLPLLEIINKMVIILTSHRWISSIHIGFIIHVCILNELWNRTRSNSWTNCHLVLDQISTINHPLIQDLIIKQWINAFQDGSNSFNLFENW